MFKAGIDQDAIVQMFSQATARQGEVLRKAVADATLKALQGRELTLTNIRKVLETVSQAASTGLGRNTLPAVDIGELLGKAFSGLDAALLQAVGPSVHATPLGELQVKGRHAPVEAYRIEGMDA